MLAIRPRQHAVATVAVLRLRACVGSCGSARRMNCDLILSAKNGVCDSPGLPLVVSIVAWTVKWPQQSVW
ncbi:MAG: hypothetical protein RL591_1285, partial [Planctomycetota bacterium]